jgi:hypothetical protein
MKTDGNGAILDRICKEDKKIDKLFHFLIENIDSNNVLTEENQTILQEYLFYF